MEDSLAASHKFLDEYLSIDHNTKKVIDKSLLPLAAYTGGPGSGKSTFLTALAEGLAVGQAPAAVKKVWNHVFPVTITFNFQSMLKEKVHAADANVETAVATRIFAR